MLRSPVRGTACVARPVWLAALMATFHLATCESDAAGPKFYADDPLLEEPDTQDAGAVQPWEITPLYNGIINTFSRPGDKTQNVRAQNVNTLDEVPDSSWYTNRIGSRPIATEDVAKGPDTCDGPGPGPWTVISAEDDGLTPKIRIRDSDGRAWHLRFDAQGYPAMATGTQVVVTKLIWALGYNVPESHIASLRPEDLVVGRDAVLTVISGRTRPMKTQDIGFVLRTAPRDRDGAYRVVASQALPGRALGGFRFYGTRPDDPNDVIPHEHRRELRGYRVFAAWLDLVDSPAIDTVDVLVSESGRSVVRHYLVHFDTALGSGALGPREHWEGNEYMFEGLGPIKRDLVSFGLRVEPWRAVPVYESRTIGRLQLGNEEWNPEAWVPRVPNPAFLRTRPDDKFWAALKLAAVTDDMIRAVVKTGQFGDPKSEDMLAKALIDRRDAIGRAYLTAINPVVRPRLDASAVLKFSNAAVDTGLAPASESYRVRWYRFDNATGASTLLGEAEGADPTFEPPVELSAEPGVFVKIEICAVHPRYTWWQSPAAAYFRSTTGGWQLVGFERIPE
ncbi:MAG: hypothetical protein AB1714_01865 [Acidobacteriota bacterium]